MITRREALARLTSFAALAAFGSTAALATEAAITSSSLNIATVPKQLALRLAHITDVHVKHDLNASKWFAKCLQHIQQQPNPPSIILNTGDSVMDTLATDYMKARELWSIWNCVLEAECSLPVKSVLGNHDCWGWGLKEKKAFYQNDPLFGKQMGLEGLGIASPFYSFDQNGWHFVMLDSSQPHAADVYTAHLDEAQFAWLEQDLAKTPPTTPVMVLSHIPILSVCVIPISKPDEQNNIVLRHRIMHTDVGKITTLFKKHKNVKVCLSGHIHLMDRVELSGVTYLCNGAVSGNWWKGSRQEVPPGYTLMNLYTDGSFEREYVPYGWQETA